MKNIETELNSFIEIVKSTEVYVDYKKTLEKLKEDPELFAKVDDYRKQRQSMQGFSGGEELFEKADVFEKDYAQLKSNPDVEAFLDAELALCRMIQEICLKLTQALDFE